MVLLFRATAYAYLPGATENSTTALVSQITHGSGSNALTYAYTYDSRGNITSETRNGLTTTYHYDALGQLVRVDDPHENATWVYAYDLGGNILSKAKYALNDLNSTPETTSFTYDATWKDKLIAVNGVEIGYDEIGNPESYGEWTYTWQAGRQLAQMAKENVTVEFAYDHNGLRTQKKVTKDGVETTTDYTLHGKLITHMTQGNNSLHFYYDANSRPAMVNFNGTMYTYVHNLQGDIVAILDTTGSIVVEYKYDAWGKPISTTGSKSSTLGKLNPFRYRGYVYDEDTRIYYLKSRYYNPYIARFVNADFILLHREHLLKCNLFSYCKNTPISAIDDTGCNEKLIVVSVRMWCPSDYTANTKGHYDMCIHGKQLFQGEDFEDIVFSYGHTDGNNTPGVVDVFPAANAFEVYVDYRSKDYDLLEYRFETTQSQVLKFYDWIDDYVNNEKREAVYSEDGKVAHFHYPEIKGPFEIYSFEKKTVCATAVDKWAQQLGNNAFSKFLQGSCASFYAGKLRKTYPKLFVLVKQFAAKRTDR